MLSPEMFTPLLTIYIEDPSQILDKEKQEEGVEKKLRFLKERRQKKKLSKVQKQELIKLEKENKKRLERRKKKGLDNPKTVSANKKKADMLDANIDPSKLKKMVTFKIQN